jgi:hypothetical protein
VYNNTGVFVATSITLNTLFLKNEKLIVIVY